MTVQVAKDPDAYLGMDKCHIDGSETPNSSYAHLDGHGHLEILMNPENPTIGESALGEGINSDSRMWVDNVFQICNQGKEAVCVYIEDHENWPEAPEEYDERRVDFYLGGNQDGTIVGEENEFLLELGDCVCIGLKTNSKGLSEGDELLEELDNEIRIIADVECGDEPKIPGEGEDGDEDDEDDDEDDGPFDADDISFMAFCTDDPLPDDASVTAIEFKDDDDEEPVTVDWNSAGVEINEIVLFTGMVTGWFFYPNGQTSGIVTTRQDDDVPDHYMTADPEHNTDRHQSKPCEDGDNSAKFEWKDDEFVREED